MFYSDTFPQIMQSLSLSRAKNAVRFRHSSSRATLGTPVSISYIYIVIYICIKFSDPIHLDVTIQKLFATKRFYNKLFENKKLISCKGVSKMKCLLQGTCLI